MTIFHCGACGDAIASVHVVGSLTLHGAIIGGFESTEVVGACKLAKASEQDAGSNRGVMKVYLRSCSSC